MNNGKKVIMDEIYDKSKDLCKSYIDLLFPMRTTCKKMADKSLYDLSSDNTFTARFKQDICQKALGIIQSVQVKVSRLEFIEKKIGEEMKEIKEGKDDKLLELCENRLKSVKKRIDTLLVVKPDLKNYSLDIGAKFVKFSSTKDSKDKRIDSLKVSAKHRFWITLTGISPKFKLNIPYLPTKHTNKLENNGYVRSNFIQYTKRSIKLVLKHDIKLKPSTSIDDKTVGCDTGIKKLCVFSNGSVIDYKYHNKHSFDDIITSMSKTVPNTKKFKRLQSFRTNYINWSINRCFNTRLADVTRIKLEDLNMSGTSKHCKTKFWNCGEIKNKLATACNERGIKVLFVDPKNTSRMCSACKHIDKNSRQGESFSCTMCKFSCDADLNASFNIRDKTPK